MRTHVPGTGLLKRFLPRSLLGRSLLMILLPLVLLQAVALQIYYGSHLDLVSRRLSFGVTSEIAYTLDLIRRFPDPADRDVILADAGRRFELTFTFDHGATLPHTKSVNILGPMDDDLTAALNETFSQPFTTDWISDPHSVLIRLQMSDGVLTIEAPRKRLYTGTIFLFVGWVVGTAFFVFLIAAMFMRNQVRAIRRLAAAAEAFGRGRDIGMIRPEGAHRGPPGRHRLQPHAGAHPPLSVATHRDAGRRVARPAHAADPPEARSGHAAAADDPPGRRRDAGRRGGDGPHDRRLPRLRPRRGRRTGRAGQPVIHAGGSRRERPPRRRRRVAGRPRR